MHPLNRKAVSLPLSLHVYFVKSPTSSPSAITRSSLMPNSDFKPWLNNCLRLSPIWRPGFWPSCYTIYCISCHPPLIFHALVPKRGSIRRRGNWISTVKARLLYRVLGSMRKQTFGEQSKSIGGMVWCQKMSLEIFCEDPPVFHTFLILCRALLAP